MFREWYETPKHIWVITELVNGGTLADVLEQDSCIPFPQVVDFVRDIASGLRGEVDDLHTYPLMYLHIAIASFPGHIHHLQYNECCVKPKKEGYRTAPCEVAGHSRQSVWSAHSLSTLLFSGIASLVFNCIYKFIGR